MVRKYFIMPVADINTPALARKFQHFPQQGGVFNNDFTKVFLSSSDPKILREIDPRDLMDKEQAKVVRATEEWDTELPKLNPPSWTADDMPLHFRDRDWFSLKAVAARYGTDTVDDVIRRVEDIKTDDTGIRTRLRSLHFTDQHITDFLADSADRRGVEVVALAMMSDPEPVTPQSSTLLSKSVDIAYAVAANPKVQKVAGATGVGTAAYLLYELLMK